MLVFYEPGSYHCYRRIMMSNEIKFKYIFEEDYNPKYVNGAFGGVSPLGEIIVNFYLERIPLPYEDIHELNDNGQIGIMKERKPEDFNTIMIRYIQSGIVLSLEQAKSIHSWLGNNIKEAERIEKMKQSAKG